MKSYDVILHIFFGPIVIQSKYMLWNLFLYFSFFAWIQLNKLYQIKKDFIN